MKISRLSSFLLYLVLSFLISEGWASEIGIFAGGYSKDSDIDRIQNLLSPGTWTSGERSFAAYLGLSWAHEFFIPLLELEHSLGAAFGAEKSAKPNIVLYSTNLHLILPVALLRVKPFLGAGLGLVYNFGNKNVLPGISDFLGNYISFQFNLGGGAKFKLTNTVWMRLSLRDYILPDFKRVRASGPSYQRFYSTVEKGTHNLSFSAALAFSY